MDVSRIYHSVLTCKIYIIPCCHQRSISDETLPFFLIKFIFRMIEMGWLQPDREELFWQCALRCGSGALFWWSYQLALSVTLSMNGSMEMERKYQLFLLGLLCCWKHRDISFLRQFLKLIASFVHFYCFTFCISFSFSINSSWKVT